MSRAVDEMIEKSVKKAVEKVVEKARLETHYNCIKNLMEFLHVGVEEVMTALKITEEDKVILMKMMQKDE